MERQKLLFIINPHSGRHKKFFIVKKIRKYIDRNIYEPKYIYTEYAGHATVLARQAVEDAFDFVVAVGGDGTVNEVARALVGTKVALGIVPVGSGIGLARHLQIPLDVKNAIRVINRRVVKTLDYGKIDGRPFFCTCGVGFDAFISEKFASYGKRGLKSYVENVLKQGFNYQSENYELWMDGEAESYKAFLITCANASQYGNNAFIAPHASMEDGIMDVVVISPFTVVEAPIIATQLLSKTLPSNPRVKMLHAKKVRITRQNEGCIHCDGDPYTAGTTIEIELVPHDFRALVNDRAHSSNLIITPVKNDLIRYKDWQLRQWRKQFYGYKRLKKFLQRRINGKKIGS